MPDPRLDGQSERSRGIIPDAALWPLCRYRHNGHWSGSGTRLNRDLSGSFGSANYAREELRAEIAQVMICAELGIPDCDFTNGAAYVAHWVSKLRDDKKEIFRAAAEAQRIADFLLAFHPDFAARNARDGAQSRAAVPPVEESDLKEAA